MSQGQKIVKLWQLFSKVPAGKRIFNRIIAWKIPYSGSIGAQITSLTAGHACLVLKDRRRIRNHLNSIHAIALTNFGELTSGLALHAGLDAQVRGIVTSITTDYEKKARGTLYSECICDIPTVVEDREFVVEALIRNAEQEVVSRVKVTWWLGLRK